MLTHCKVWLAMLLVTFPAPAIAVPIAPPPNDIHVVDLASLLAPEDELWLNEFCERHRATQGIPLYVVTVISLAEHNGRVDSIESFTRSLYEQWGQDESFGVRSVWRRGILLLVARDDREVRIELGHLWGGGYDASCERIVQREILPAFKQGAYSDGIRAGVVGLSNLARGEVEEERNELLDVFLLVLVVFAGLGGVVFLLTSIGTGPSEASGERDPDKVYDDDDYHDSGGDSSYGGGGGATGSW